MRTAVAVPGRGGCASGAAAMWYSSRANAPAPTKLPAGSRVSTVEVFGERFSSSSVTLPSLFRRASAVFPRGVQLAYARTISESDPEPEPRMKPEPEPEPELKPEPELNLEPAREPERGRRCRSTSRTFTPISLRHSSAA